MDEKSVVSFKKRNAFADVWHRMRRDKAAMGGLGFLILLILCAVFAPIVCRFDYAAQDLRNTFQFPDGVHWFGTDRVGRDVFARIIYGARVSFAIAFTSEAISLCIGTTLGVLACFYKRLDNLIMRVMDVLMAMPSTLMSIAIIGALGPGVRNLIIALTIANIPSYARISRAAVLTIIDQEYIEAAKSVGVNNWRLVFAHILPNSIGTIIIAGTMNIAVTIIRCAGLSFVGLGISAPTPEWGSMLAEGRQYIRTAWYLTVIPGLFIMATAYACNLLGDALRDALDPRLQN